MNDTECLDSQVPEERGTHSEELQAIQQSVSEEMYDTIQEYNQHVQDDSDELIEPEYYSGEEFDIAGLDFILTQSPLPTMYDVRKDGNIVGCVRLRSGVVQAIFGVREPGKYDMIYDVSYRDVLGGCYDACSWKDLENIARLIAERLVQESK